MHARRKERSTERPPSPAAPDRRRRTRLAAGAAALGIGIATALAPAAADELASDDRPTEKVEDTRTEVAEQPLDLIRAERIQAAEAYEKTQRETLFFEVLKNQEEERVLAFYQALEEQAARAEAERRAAEEAAAAEERAAQESDDADASGGGSPAATGPAPSGGPWQALAQCESGGNWSINTGNGYYGGLQFSLSTWQGHGGSGMPHQASAGEQIAVAQRVQASQGWGAWPSCSAQLGLR